MKILSLSICACAILLNSTSFADASHAPLNLTPSNVSTIGSANLSTLNLDIDLTDGYGIGYFYKVPKNNEERFINQGYASLNVFHYVDAYRSFKKAYSLNHKSVLALVGMSYSVLTQDSSRAGATLAAVSLNEAYKISQMKELTEQEKSWLNFAKAFFMIKIGDSSFLNDKTPVDAGKAFQNLASVDGDNLEFKTFIHWIVLNNNNFQYIKSVIESVLDVEAKHTGAHHYLLHIAEMTDDVETAQMHGEILITLALESGHAQHMYGHTLPQTGEWKKALEQFLIADEIHKDWAVKNNVNISEDWHYAHNLDLLAATYLGLGDNQNALTNWSMAMAFDARAIQKMIGLALAIDELDLAAKSLDQIEARGPQYKNFVSFLRSEQMFLSSNIKPTAFPNTEFGALLKMTYQSQLSEVALSAQFNKYFTAKFNSGGFDGWSNGFVELIRAKNIAEKLGLNSLKNGLAVLEIGARSGKL